MSARAKLTPDDPSSFSYTLHVSYTLAQWELIRQKLQEGTHSWSYPMSDLVEAIQDATRQATKNFEPAHFEP